MHTELLGLLKVGLHAAICPVGSHQKLKQCNSDLQIKIGDTLTQRVTASKSLGMMIDETLTWHAQNDLITKKVNKGLYVLRRSNNICC